MTVDKELLVKIQALANHVLPAFGATLKDKEEGGVINWMCISVEEITETINKISGIPNPPTREDIQSLWDTADYAITSDLMAAQFHPGCNSEAIRTARYIFGDIQELLRPILEDKND